MLNSITRHHSNATPTRRRVSKRSLRSRVPIRVFVAVGTVLGNTRPRCARYARAFPCGGSSRMAQSSGTQVQGALATLAPSHAEVRSGWHSPQSDKSFMRSLRSRLSIRVCVAVGTVLGKCPRACKQAAAPLPPYIAAHPTHPGGGFMHRT